MRIQLTTDISDALLSLLPQHPHLVDGVEAGPWFPPAQVRAYRQELPPTLPIYFHGADLVHNVGLRPGALRQIQSYLSASGSPWLSLHLSAWVPLWLRRLKRRWPLLGLRPHPALAAMRIVTQIRQLSRAVPVPLLLENVEPLPWAGYDYYARPTWLNPIFIQTGCALLLDTGHARVAAAAFGCSPHEYLRQLPLERVIQVHVSGPRERDGRLSDAHEPLQEEDYTLLEWALQKTHPQVVTLEYIREPAGLYTQLSRLRELISS